MLYSDSMKTKLLFLALVAVAAMSTWAQSPIVNFPQAAPIRCAPAVVLTHQHIQASLL